MANKNEFKEESLEIKANVIKKIRLGFNEEAFLLILGYQENINTDEEKLQEFAAQIKPASILKLIEGLFDCGRAYQNKYGIDIGFGDAKEELT